MAGHGPAPSAKRARAVDEARRNAEMVTREQTEDLHGMPLPIGILPNGEDWHPQTLALWRSLRRDPFTSDETELGWQFLVDTALMHHTMWTKGKWEFAAEIRLRLAKFGATPEDRQRLKRKVVTTKDDGEFAPPPVSGDKVVRRGQLRIAE